MWSKEFRGLDGVPNPVSRMTVILQTNKCARFAKPQIRHSKINAVSAASQATAEQTLQSLSIMHSHHGNLTFYALLEYPHAKTPRPA
mmetsp:Transcript_32736/g.51081  ORF Transcript_32736/g.51081 Transcript_32736/m.51081 type:complete len:87 (-) Transcript_32736:1165-1425(-)